MPWNWTVGTKEMGHIINLIAASREAIGYEIDLAIDCHGQFDVPSAITLAKAVEPLRLMWLEEPVPAENIEAMAQVKAGTSTVICTGENQYTRWRILELLQKKACDVIMPDLSKAGGMMEAKRIADMADAFYIPIAPHNVSSPLGMMAMCHVMAAVPNFLVLEFHGREICHGGMTCAMAINPLSIMVGCASPNVPASVWNSTMPSPKRCCGMEILILIKAK